MDITKIEYIRKLNQIGNNLLEAFNSQESFTTSDLQAFIDTQVINAIQWGYKQGRQDVSRQLTETFNCFTMPDVSEGMKSKVIHDTMKLLKEIEKEKQTCQK